MCVCVKSSLRRVLSLVFASREESRGSPTPLRWSTERI